MKEHPNLKGHIPFTAYSYDFATWAEVNSFSPVSENFVLLLLADFSNQPRNEIVLAAKQLIDKGLKYVCCWGIESEQGHDGFDLGNIEWNEVNKKSLHVMSTWHEESLADAVWFCLYVAVPDDEYWPNCSTAIVNINNTAPQKELDKLLSDPEYLNEEANVT